MSNERFQKIEEAAAFADQRADALDEAIRDLADRLEGVTRRLARIESRLGAIESAAAEHDSEQVDPAEDRPPHSGRLPGDR